jgi:hypothetical protein
MRPADSFLHQRDPDADLARARDRQQEDVRTRASGRAEVVGGDDRRSIARERRRVGSEVAEHRGGESADTDPQRKKPERADPVLRESCGQHHDRRCADHGADHRDRPDSAGSRSVHQRPVAVFPATPCLPR